VRPGAIGNGDRDERQVDHTAECSAGRARQRQTLPPRVGPPGVSWRHAQ
jgi:hypothetical protein